MLNKSQIDDLMNMTTHQLVHLLADSEYTGLSFQSSKFVGLTGNGDFCYSVKFFDESGTGEIETAKVYASYDSKTSKLVADF